MGKKEKKFRERDDIDKFVEEIVNDKSQLQKALIDQLTVQQWISILLLFVDESRLNGVVELILNYRE